MVPMMSMIQTGTRHDLMATPRMECRRLPYHSTRDLGDGLLRVPLLSERPKATAVFATMTTIASEHDLSVHHQPSWLDDARPGDIEQGRLLEEPGETDGDEPH